MKKIFENVSKITSEQEGDSRKDIICSLQHAGRDLQLIRSGKLEGRPVEELLKEL
jgi:hypothetical protein